MEEPEDPARPSNLWEPVEGNDAAHGRFDGRAQSKSLQLWAAERIGWYKGLAAITIALLAIGAGIVATLIS